MPAMTQIYRRPRQRGRAQILDLRGTTGLQFANWTRDFSVYLLTRSLAQVWEGVQCA